VGVDYIAIDTKLKRVVALKFVNVQTFIKRRLL
jgi:hypothetical protein